MTVLDDFIAQLRQYEIAPVVQPIKAQVELFVSALNSIASGSTVTLGGDVTGLASANTVGKIQGNAVQSGAPSDGNGLVWDSVNGRFALQSVGLLNTQIFNASGTYTPTPGTKSILVRLWGGGGGGGGAAGVAAQASLAQSAGGGSYSEGFLSGILNASSGTVTIGAGGTAGTTAGTNGGIGGTSSFLLGALNMSCPGGSLGTGDAVTGITAATLTGAAQSSAPTGGYFNYNGAGADPSGRLSNSVNFSGSGGASFGLVRSGRGVGTDSPGFTGTIAGGGSAGCSNSAGSPRAGGTGGQGLCIIEEYA